MIVLDTHAWVWFVSNPELLSKTAEKAVQRAAAQNAAFISSISAWEVAMLVAKGRMEMTMDVTDWIARSEALPFFRFVPVDNAIAVKAVQLPPPLHPDPADRIVVATALSLGVPVVTKDTKIQGYSRVRTIW